MELSFDEYQLETAGTAIYGEAAESSFWGRNYCITGLAGEAGEVSNKWGKIIRDREGMPNSEDVTEISKELGDVLWFLARTADELGLSLEVIAQQNLAKLQKRKADGKLSGSGDNR